MTTAPWKLSRADPRLIAQASQRLSSRRRWLLSFRPRLRLLFAASSETCAPAPSSCGSFAPFPIAARARSTRTIVIFEADFSLFKRKQNPDERRRMRAGALTREPVQRLAVRGKRTDRDGRRAQTANGLCGSASICNAAKRPSPFSCLRTDCKQALKNPPSRSAARCAARPGRSRAGRPSKPCSSRFAQRRAG